MSVSHKFKDYLNLIETETNYEKIHEYLVESIDLCNEATLMVDDNFPINLVVFNTIINDDYVANLGEFQKDYENRISLISNCLKLLFIFCKNLLTNFAVYPDKEIKESNPQVDKYLKWLPNYRDYMMFIGYKLIEERETRCQVWVYAKRQLKRLPKDEVSKLIAFSISCWVGVIVFENLAFMEKLRIFEQECAKLRRILPELLCELCGSHTFDTQTYQCRNCVMEAPLWLNRDFHRQFNKQNRRASFASSYQSYKFYFSEFEDSEIEEAFEREDTPSQSPILLRTKSGTTSNWTCTKCTTVNADHFINCNVCSTNRRTDAYATLESIDVEKAFDRVDVDVDSADNNKNSTEISRSSNLNIVSSLPKIEETWICTFCTFKNQKHFLNCVACQCSKKFELDKVNEKLATIQTNKQKIEKPFKNFEKQKLSNSFSSYRSYGDSSDPKLNKSSSQEPLLDDDVCRCIPCSII